MGKNGVCGLFVGILQMQKQKRFLEEHRTKANPGSFLHIQKTMIPIPLGMIPAASPCQLVNIHI